MADTGAIIFLIALIGFFGPLLIFGILKLTKRNLGNHPAIGCFLMIIAIISGLTLVIMVSGLSQDSNDTSKPTKTEIVLKEANLTDLQGYIANNLNSYKAVYNKETKKVIIDTDEISDIDNIAEIDKKLAKNDKIKSVEFTNRGKSSRIILIINLK